LGYCNFGGANDHQIQKFHLGWKVDIYTFPTSPLLPHLDTWKYLKSTSKGTQPVQELGATHWAVFTGIQSTAQQNAVLTGFDFLELIFILLVVNDVTL